MAQMAVDNELINPKSPTFWANLNLLNVPYRVIAYEQVAPSKNRTRNLEFARFRLLCHSPFGHQMRPRTIFRLFLKFRATNSPTLRVASGSAAAGGDFRLVLLRWRRPSRTPSSYFLPRPSSAATRTWTATACLQRWNS